MTNIPIPTTSPQQGDISSSDGPDHINQVQTSGHGSTLPINLEPSPIIPNQSNLIGEVKCSSTREPQTLLTIFPTGLERSREYSELFYWDSSINIVVWNQWDHRAAKRYNDFISKLKKNGVQRKSLPNDVRQSWMRRLKDPKCVEKSEINANNRYGNESGVATGTHTGGSISVGEYHKRLAIKMGRDPTPSEIYLHVHTQGNDGKSCVGEKSRIIHYQKILQQQTQSQSDIDKCKAYYEAAGVEKKRTVYGIGFQAKCYYVPNLRDSYGSGATSSATPSNAQSTPIGNMDELVTRLIHVLTDHIVHIIVERAR
uniref:Uncharacterized protein n=1 Tax=Nicotiana tabacum TaxID=4097 RepID=A0A1S4BNB2_TOBAC|nr:PREDICTED: uncharacterized protein LOC107810128 [Nicotiana tabacum]